MISIIIVHYHVLPELLHCLASIYAQKTVSSFEVIVVDNQQNPENKPTLLKQFPKIRYIQSSKNLGYSGGNNLGATHAKGEYLFFLNPDTKCTSNVLDVLVSFLKKQPAAGAVAPLLLDKNKNPLNLQGTKKLGILQALVGLSVLNKWFPNNPISKAFWQQGWDKTQVKQVEIVPGTAFMIQKKVFEAIGRFDQRYFLYFEEYDLGKRLSEKGYKNYIVPKATLIHYWAKSTAVRDDIERIFQKSRFSYFQKFYGTVAAVLVEGVLRMSFETGMLALIILVATFLRFYEIDKHMMFIGDFGWFYLSARDLVISGNIPLVGIASSHPWIHQGAFWTYLLAPALWLGNFNPVAGGYLAAGIGVLTVILLYIFTKEFFGKQAAFFSALFFATSPLVIIHARMPYHTAPIPLFVLLYMYSVYRWVKGSSFFFALSFFFLIVLYNFELAASVLLGPVALFFLYGVFAKKTYVKKVMQWRVLLVSLGFIFLPLIPMLVYDTQHYFGQTLGYIAWLGYRILLLFGFPSLHPEIASPSYLDIFTFVYEYQKRFYYYPNAAISLVLFFSSLLIIGKRYTQVSYQLLFLFFFIPFLGLIISKTPSEAYLPMLFLQLAIFLGILFSSLLKGTIFKKSIVYVIFFALCSMNALTLIQNQFFLGNNQPYGQSYAQRVSKMNEIITQANEKPFRIVPSAYNSEFASFIMPYEYLLWWMGKPTDRNASQIFEIEETSKAIHIIKQY